MADKQNEIPEALLKQLNLSPDAVRESCGTGRPEDLLKHIDSDKAEQVTSILNDPEKTKEILGSPEAQALMKLLNGQ